MIQLVPKNRQAFMKLFLLSDTFDLWELVECSIQTHSTLHIDGTFHSAFYTQDDSEKKETFSTFTPWKYLRSVCMEYIKGKHTPLAFRFVLRYSPTQARQLLDEAQIEENAALYLNLRFEQERLFLTTGTAVEVFSLDKTIENFWDRYVEEFLTQLNIQFD